MLQMYGPVILGRTVPTMEGFARSYQRGGGDPANVMRCFRPEQLPALTALAKHYLVCDNWFASVPASHSAQPSICAFRDVVRPGRLHAHLARARKGHLRPAGGREEKGRIYYYSPQSGTFGMTFLGSKYFGLYGDFLADCRRGNLPEYSRSSSLRTTINRMGRSRPISTRTISCWPAIVSSGASTRPSARTTRCGAPRSSSSCGTSTAGCSTTCGRRAFPTEIRSGPIKPQFDFDQLGPRVGAVVVSPYVKPGVDHTLFEHASIPATVTQQFIGDPGRHAPYLREKKANTMLPLLADIAPRMEWPSSQRCPRGQGTSPYGGRSGFLLPVGTRARGLMLALADRAIRASLARSIPRPSERREDVSAFIAERHDGSPSSSWRRYLRVSMP